MKLFAFVFSVLFFAIGDAVDAVSWNATEFNFGEIQQNIPATATYELTNNGDTPLFIQNVKVGCGCTVPKYSTEAILPGQTTKIEAIFNAKKVGKFNKTVSVSTSITDEPTILRLSGEVLAKK